MWPKMRAHILISKYNNLHCPFLNCVLYFAAHANTRICALSFAVHANMHIYAFALFERVQALSYVPTRYLSACAKAHMCLRPFFNACIYRRMRIRQFVFFQRNDVCKACRRRKNRLFALKMRRICIGLFDLVRRTFLLSCLKSSRDARQAQAFRRG